MNWKFAMNVGVPFILMEKEEKLRVLTEETLSKMLDVRGHWLSLSAPYKNFTDVAKKSLKLIDDFSNFSLERINSVV